MRISLFEGGAYVPTVFVGMYAPLGTGRAQTCHNTAPAKRIERGAYPPTAIPSDFIFR